MKTTTTVAALHALLGPPLGGLALVIAAACLDKVYVPTEGPIPDPIQSVGGLMFVALGSYAVGTIPAFCTGLLLGHKASRSGTYGAWDAVLAALISSMCCLVLFDLTLAKGRPNGIGLHNDQSLYGIIVGASIIAAVACRRLLIWAEYIDRG